MPSTHHSAPRPWRRLMAGVIAAGATALASASPAAAAADPLERLAARAPDRTVETIVQLDPSTPASSGRELVRRHGGRVTDQLHIINALGARLSAAQAERLRDRPGVAQVSLNARMEPQSVPVRNLAETYDRAVGNLDVWNTNGEVTGRGVGVAVIDTGIAGNLADFRVSQADAGSRVVASAVTNPNARTAADTFGHGTHVAGIIAGNGNNRPAGDPLLGRYLGIAPNASLISVKVSDDAGAATILDVIYGLQFAVDHKDAYNIRVVNLSLESTQPGSYKSDPLAAAAEAAWFKGLVVVAAVGNRGTAADAVHYAPGNDPYVISVGAVDDKETNGLSDDVVAPWSSRGVTQDGFAKPDVHAPGSAIVSTIPPASAYAEACPACVVERQYFRAGGTSMAAPMVSGAVAMLLERYPQLTPNQVKAILTSTARSLPGGFPAIFTPAALKDALSIAPANAGLTPSPLIDPATGGIDYTRSSWSRSSWSGAQNDLIAGWARSSWSCNCSLSATGAVDPNRSSWSRSSWSTAWGL